MVVRKTLLLAAMVPAVIAMPLPWVTNSTNSTNTTNNNNTTPDSITNGIITQALPLIALFGENATNLFLSQSISALDCVIFAVGPLGVIWTLKATIRVLGFRYLKTCFGVAFEDVSLIERDLMSSTSENVCELWNGQGVSRIVGRPQIKEVLLINKKIINTKDKEDYFVKRDLRSGPCKPSKAHKNNAIANQDTKPPNMLLNLGPKERVHHAWMVLVIAVALEVYFFALIVLMEWQHQLKNRFKVSLAYFILTAAGTASLLLGLIGSAWGINRATTRTSWTPRKHEVPDEHKHKVHGTPIVVWLQRGTENNVGHSSSYIIIKDIKNELIESHLIQGFKQFRSGWVGAGCSLCLILITVGYVCQIVGTAKMHYPTQISLFGITIIMAVARAFLRQTPEPMQVCRVKHMCEMDYLAVFYRLDIFKNLYKSPANTRPTGPKPPTWAIIGGQTWRPKFESYPTKTSQGLLRTRRKLGKICEWNCQATEMAHALTLSIEAVANKFLPPDTEESTFKWHLMVDLGFTSHEKLTLSVKRNADGRWKQSEEDIRSALSLWLFYYNTTRPDLIQDEERSLRLLGPPWVGENLGDWFQLTKLRYVRNFRDRRDKSEATTNESEGAGTAKKTCLRNRIVGFNENLQIDLPSQDPKKSKFSPTSIHSGKGYKYDFIMSLPKVVSPEDLATTRPDFRTPSPVALAYISTDQLYAQHMLSGFMWEMTRRFKPAERGYFPTEQNKDSIRDLADEIQVTRLGDREDAFLSILPPIICQNGRRSP